MRQGALKTSPLVILAAFALRVARRRLPTYAHRCSPRTYSQPALLAALAFKPTLGGSYRRLAAGLARQAALRAALGLRRVPHYSTFQRFARRAAPPGLVREVFDGAFGRTVRLGRWRRRGSGTEVGPESPCRAPERGAIGIGAASPAS